MNTWKDRVMLAVSLLVVIVNALDVTFISAFIVVVN